MQAVRFSRPPNNFHTGSNMLGVRLLSHATAYEVSYAKWQARNKISHGETICPRRLVVRRGPVDGVTN